VTLVYSTIAQALDHAKHTAVAPLRWDPVTHLLSRFTFGPTVDQRAYVHKYGPDAWYRMQVANAAKYPGYAGSTAVAKQGPLLKLSPYDLTQWLIAQGNEYGWDAMDQLGQVTMGLQVWSAAQLYETLVDFFANHLNVANHDGDVWNTRHTFDRDVIRPHATGSFTNMLLASAKSPAMLIFLNLAESTKVAVNENYGRELLELHTVGLHYTESDVQAMAKLLTGRTLDDNQHYLYDDYIHWTGPVTVMGLRLANSTALGGEAAGDAMLRHLASHEDTAQHLAQKLCVRYVSDSPSAALVDAVAESYLKNKTEILPTVSTILRSTEFWESRGRKVRRPFENLAATIRVLGLRATDVATALQTLMWMSSDVGNLPLDWSAPNGYPDVAASWRSAGTLLRVWDYHLSLAGGWTKDAFSVPSIPALYSSARTSGEAVAAIGRALTGLALPSAHLAALQTFLDEPASTPIASSSLRWNDYVVAALVLDGPHHALR
jgi:hypothetical protein